MVAVPQNILTQALNVPHETRLASALIGAMDTAPGETVPWANDFADAPTGDLATFDGFETARNTYLGLQYWPESVQDSRGSEWNPRNIPGGSHPIYQWTHGGERRISFTAMFTTDTAPPDETSGQDDPYADLSVLGGVQKGTRDMDIRAVINWLRYFTYPKYGTGADLRAYEPPKCILVFPNTGLGYDGSDYIVSVMTQCDVTYEAWFPNGVPRLCEVSLEFAEVVQFGNRVRFHDRTYMSRSRSLASYLRPRAPQGGYR
jgi:hypothetical protein